MTTLKVHNNFLVTEPKDMEIGNLPNKEFKRIVLRNPNDPQENTENQFNEIRKQYMNKMRSLTKR